MKISKSRSVEAAIRTLDEEERRKVVAWLAQLANWESDEHIRKMSKPTGHENVHVLNTSDDLRIFFELDSKKNEISVLDIARPSRFENIPVTPE
jgi:mRNA-degrading endonuclease RelE of RelBE toxin-antitoxin system